MCKDASRDKHYFKGAHTSLGQVIMFVNGIIRESVDSSSFAGFQKFPAKRRLTKGSTEMRIMLHSLFIALFWSGYSLSLSFGLSVFSRAKRCCSWLHFALRELNCSLNNNNNNSRNTLLKEERQRDNPKAAR